MNNFIQRTLTGFFFVVVMIGSIVLGQTVFSVLLLIITIFSLNEFVTIVSNDINQPAFLPTVAAGGLVYILLAANAISLISAEWLFLIVPIFFLLIIAELWRNKPFPFTNIATSFLGIVYIAVPFGLMMYFFDPVILSGAKHYGIVLGFLIILWLNDTGAYLVGSRIGKHKLFERISPGKTWEGSAGGAFFAILAAYGLSFVFVQLEDEQWMVLAVIIVVFGTLGDLSESMLKRSLGIKDSGNILPGHGGMLDRFDAVLLSAPFVFVYLALFCR
ncbi:MAG: phosphatidate cytidylyltransferase [Bacteroidales bacterium]